MKRCELCKSMATIYCESDRASLCWTCDAKVHSANFLVAKHSRSLLCQICQSPTLWSSSGEKLCPSTAAICRSCDVKGVSDEGNNKGEIGNADGDEIDNQVVAWSSTLLPPAVSSSSSEEVFSGDGGGSLKRKHQKVADYNSHEDEIDSSSVNINHYKPSSKVGTVRDRKKLGDRNVISEEKMHAPLLRRGKSRRTVELDLNLPAIE